MIVDSSALLAIIFSEPERAVFASAIMADPQPLLSSASYLEVALRLDRLSKRSPDPRLDQSIAELGINLVPVTVEDGYAARRAFGRYGRSHPARLNFGDCLSYALAKTSGEPLLFKGNDFGLTDLRLVDVGLETKQ